MVTEPISTQKIKKRAPKHIYQLSEELYSHLSKMIGILGYVGPRGGVGTETAKYVLETDFPISPYNTKRGVMKHTPEVEGNWLYRNDVFPIKEDKLNCPLVTSLDKLLQLEPRLKNILKKEQIKKIRQDAELEISHIREKEITRIPKFLDKHIDKSGTGSYWYYLNRYSPDIDIELFENDMIILGKDESERPFPTKPGEKYIKIIAVYDRNNKLVSVRREPYEIIDFDELQRFLNDFEVLKSGKDYEYFKSLEPEIAKFREQPAVKCERVKVKAEARIRRLKRRRRREGERIIRYKAFY